MRVTSLWWLWLLITIPITGITITCWWLYKKHKAKEAVGAHYLWSKTKEVDGDTDEADGNQNAAGGSGSGRGGTPNEKGGSRIMLGFGRRKVSK